MNNLIEKHRLSPEQVAQVGKSLDYILKTIGVDGLQALTEIHESNPIKAHFINEEISSHIKAKRPKQPKRNFFG